MVIARPEWFKRRKYFGWGLIPVVWQGWVYTLAMILITIGLIELPLDIMYKIVVYAIWAVLLVVDLGSAMVRIKDEREKVHEAIAERNALWTVVMVAAVGISYQVASSAVKNDFSNVDWFLVAAIVAALIVKAISNLWLDWKD